MAERPFRAINFRFEVTPFPIPPPQGGGDEVPVIEAGASDAAAPQGVAKPRLCRT